MENAFRPGAGSMEMKEALYFGRVPRSKASERTGKRESPNNVNMGFGCAVPRTRVVIDPCVPRTFQYLALSLQTQAPFAQNAVNLDATIECLYPGFIPAFVPTSFWPPRASHPQQSHSQRARE